MNSHAVNMISRLLRDQASFALRFTLASWWLLAGCGGGGGAAGPSSTTPELSAINISLSRPALYVGQQATAAAQGRDQFKNEFSIGVPAWSTAAAAIATVSTSGVVTGVSPGQTTVFASFGGKQGQYEFKVLPVPVASVVISPSAPSLTAGATRQLTATVLTDSGRVLTDRIVFWASLDPTKASVSSSGLVTALSPGTVTITATCDGIVAPVVVTIPGAAGSVSTVTITPAIASVQVGSTTPLTVILRDVAGNILTGRTVTWTASVVTGASNAVSVSSTGIVTGGSVGVATIEALSEGQRGTAVITVTPAVDPGIVVTFAEPTPDATVGDTLDIVVGATPHGTIVSAIAEAGSLQIPLELIYIGMSAQPLWVGHLNVADLKNGPYVLTVTATDASGARGIGTLPFVRDVKFGKAGSSPAPKQKTLIPAKRPGIKP